MKQKEILFSKFKFSKASQTNKNLI